MTGLAVTRVNSHVRAVAALVFLSGVAGNLGCSSGSGARSAGGDGGGGGAMTAMGGKGGALGGLGGTATGGSGGGAATGGSGMGGALGSGGTSPGGAPGFATAAALDPLIQAFCAASRACCKPGDVPDERLGDCETTAAVQLDTTGLVAGRVTLNAAPLAACVTAYQHAATTCSTDEVFSVCRELLTGTVPIGGTCSHVWDCKKDQGPTACFATQVMTEPPYLLVGVCRLEPAGKLGDACMASCPLGSDCSTAFVTDTPDQSITLCHEKDGLYCNPDHLCAALSTMGGACSPSSFGDDCPAATYCDEINPPTPACVARNAPGAACDFNSTCTTGYTCVDHRCAPRPLDDDRSCTGIPRYPGT